MSCNTINKSSVARRWLPNEETVLANWHTIITQNISNNSDKISTLLLIRYVE